jgi:hypothetical protein
MPTILTLTVNTRPALETKYQERKWLEQLLLDAAHDLGQGGVITSPILNRDAPKTAVGTIVWGPDALNP